MFTLFRTLQDRQKKEAAKYTQGWNKLPGFHRRAGIGLSCANSAVVNFAPNHQPRYAFVSEFVSIAQSDELQPDVRGHRKENYLNCEKKHVEHQLA